MSTTIRSLVVPVSDLDAAKNVYTALLGAPHTDESYYVGYNIDGFEVGLAPGEVAGGPVAYADVEDLDATRATLLAAGATERDAPRKSHPRRGCACSPTPTATRLGCAAGSHRCGRAAAVLGARSGPRAFAVSGRPTSVESPNQTLLSRLQTRNVAPPGLTIPLQEGRAESTCPWSTACDALSPTIASRSSCPSTTA